MADYILELDHVTKDFGQVQALKGVSLQVEPGKFITLLGPSGCGKTTTLRIIAGLEEPTQGRVFLEGEDVTHLEPNKRDLNTVFQNYALFPHMNVAENIGYSQKLQRVDKKTIDQRVNEMLELVQLEGYNQRLPQQLSGGQRQRVAIARALINRPKVLLLDEPLGALDLQLRLQMQAELKEIQQDLGITFVYITHDQEEAMNMSDRIVVMREGIFEQIGSPKEIYNTPRTTYVAQFVGSANVVKGNVSAVTDDVLYFDADGRGRGMVAPAGAGLQLNDPLTVAIRGENIDVVLKERLDHGPCFPGIVSEINFVGGSLHIHVALDGGGEIISYHQGIESPVELGARVCATWDPNRAVLIDLEGEHA